LKSANSTKWLTASSNAPGPAHHVEKISEQPTETIEHLRAQYRAGAAEHHQRERDRAEGVIPLDR
jgi:hypothetical protein